MIERDANNKMSQKEKKGKGAELRLQISEFRILGLSAVKRLNPQILPELKLDPGGKNFSKN